MFPELWTPLDFSRILGLRRLDTIEDLANHLDSIIIGKIISFHLIFYFDLSFLDTPTTSTQNHTTRVDIDARFLEFVGLSCINPDNYYHLPRLSVIGQQHHSTPTLTQCLIGSSTRMIRVERLSTNS